MSNLRNGDHLEEFTNHVTASAFQTCEFKVLGATANQRKHSLKSIQMPPVGDHDGALTDHTAGDTFDKSGRQESLILFFVTIKACLK